jgi:hypothetical protein
MKKGKKDFGRNLKKIRNCKDKIDEGMSGMISWR